MCRDSRHACTTIRQPPDSTLAQYHAGTKFPTAERFSWHLSGAFSDPMGARLGRQFDDLHLDMVNEQTTGFYPGITEMLLEVVEEAV